MWFSYLHVLFPHHSTTDRQPFLCLILEQYTQGPFQLFEGQVTTTYKMFIPDGPLVLMLQQLMLSFCLMQQTVNIFKPQWHPTTATLTTVYHISNTTTFSNRDISVHYLLSLGSRSTYYNVGFSLHDTAQVINLSWPACFKSVFAALYMEIYYEKINK